MKTKRILTITILSLVHTIFLGYGLAQEYTKWNLPDGAVARFGKGWIKSISYSADGTRLAVASSTGIWIYDADTGVELMLLAGNEGGTGSVAFSPDGKFLASGGYGEILLWDVATGKILKTYKGHKGWVGVGFKDDSKTFISLDQGSFVFWDISSGRKIREIKIRNTSDISRFFLSLFGLDAKSFHLYLDKVDDNGIIAYGYENGIVRLKDATTGRQLRYIQGHNDFVNQLTISPDGKILAVDIFNAPLSLWDISTGRKIKVLSRSGSMGGIFSFSKDGKTFIYQTAVNGIELWDVESGTLRTTIGADINTIRSLVFSPDAKYFVGGSSDGTIRTWDALTGEEVSILTTGHIQDLNVLTYSKDGRKLAGGYLDTIMLWDLNSNALISGGTEQVEELVDIEFSADSKTVTSIGKVKFKIEQRGELRKESVIGKLSLWDTSNGQNLLISPVESTNIKALQGQGYVSSSTEDSDSLWISKTIKTSNGIEKGLKYQRNGLVVFSQDSSLLAVPRNSFKAPKDDRFTVVLWDVQGRKVLYKLKGHRKEITALVFSPDGNIIASGSKDRMIRLWETNTGEQIQAISSGLNTALVFSPDGKRIANVQNKNLIHIWDVFSGRKVVALKGKIGDCYALAYSPDGKFLASGSHDGTVMLWDVKTGRELRKFIGHDNWIRTVEFSPDSKTLASGSQDGVIFIWNIPN